MPDAAVSLSAWVSRRSLFPASGPVVPEPNNALSFPPQSSRTNSTAPERRGGSETHALIRHGLDEVGGGARRVPKPNRRPGWPVASLFPPLRLGARLGCRPGRSTSELRSNSAPVRLASSGLVCRAEIWAQRHWGMERAWRSGPSRARLPFARVARHQLPTRWRSPPLDDEAAHLDRAAHSCCRGSQADECAVSLWGEG